MEVEAPVAVEEAVEAEAEEAAEAEARAAPGATTAFSRSNKVCFLTCQLMTHLLRSAADPMAPFKSARAHADPFSRLSL